MKTRNVYKNSIHSEASNGNVPEIFMHNSTLIPHSGCIHLHTKIIFTFNEVRIPRNNLGLLCNLQHSCTE